MQSASCSCQTNDRKWAHIYKGCFPVQTCPRDEMGYEGQIVLHTLTCHFSGKKKNIQLL